MHRLMRFWRVRFRALHAPESESWGIRSRLSQLGGCFVSGKPAPRQRKAYKKRIAKTNRFLPSISGTEM